jgi:hypothetical protein
MSIELSQLGPDGEQQLGINPSSSDGGQQMGCPLSSPIIVKKRTTNGNQPMSMQ